MIQQKEYPVNGIIATERFLGLIFSGQVEEALQLVAPEARLIGSRPAASPENPLFGTHIGPQGARHFFSAFAALMEPGDFTIDGRFGTRTEACLHGTLRHRVRATGRDFASDWALITRWHDGQLFFYHFYEDTAALASAMQPDHA